VFSLLFKKIYKLLHFVLGLEPSEEKYVFFSFVPHKSSHFAERLTILTIKFPQPRGSRSALL
jgi:hypothetical protein